MVAAWQWLAMEKFREWNSGTCKVTIKVTDILSNDFVTVIELEI